MSPQESAAFGYVIADKNGRDIQALDADRDDLLHAIVYLTNNLEAVAELWEGRLQEVVRGFRTGRSPEESC